MTAMEKMIEDAVARGCLVVMDEIKSSLEQAVRSGVSAGISDALKLRDEVAQLKDQVAGKAEKSDGYVSDAARRRAYAQHYGTHARR